jgi:hypothetical protein
MNSRVVRLLLSTEHHSWCNRTSNTTSLQAVSSFPSVHMSQNSSQLSMEHESYAGIHTFLGIHSGNIWSGSRLTSVSVMSSIIDSSPWVSYLVGSQTHRQYVHQQATEYNTPVPRLHPTCIVRISKWSRYDSIRPYSVNSLWDWCVFPLVLLSQNHFLILGIETLTSHDSMT